MYDQTYKCIMIDPPWNERGGGVIKRGADRHYNLLASDQIYEVIINAPCWKPDPNSLLWLWSTNNFLIDALNLMVELEYKYITNLVWVKPSIGLGQRTRQRHELLLLGRRGSVPIPETKNRPDSVIEAPRTRHSEKPEIAYTLIEKSCDGPRLEMFARSHRNYWTSWGDEL